MIAPRTFGSLFAGIGGIDLGLERAGWECKWQVENDSYCQRVLAKHWPDVPKYGDIKELSGKELSPVNMISAGFPCQDLSVAGKRKGIHGERSGLFFELMRIVRVVRPRFLLLENVPGLLAQSEWMGAVLEELAKSGYDAEWNCIPAAAVGAPHHRDRWYLVAHNKPCKHSAKIFAGKIAPHNDFTSWNTRRNELDGMHGIEWCNSYSEIRGTMDGIPHGLDRIGLIGNAVIPQVAEWIGRRILEAMK